MENGVQPVERAPGWSPATAATHEGCTVLETLYRDARTTVFRALRRDGGSVVLKVLDPRRCREKDLQRLRREYEMGASLDLDSAVRPCGLETYEGMPALVLEDFGGEPLERLAMPMPPERFLDLAARIAGAVAEVHDRGIVHKDLKPANIFVDLATSSVKIADFGIATRLRREQQSARPPELIEGSLPYMSPEQTGRMNRTLDCRSDLYSLGVTFYRVLTGRLPFEGRDPLEWVHCHVARVPPSPAQLVPDLPEPIAKIVMKLLAKMPEDRYQTARGLRRDLAACLERWRESGRIDPFPLGARDVPDRLQIPQKLYGREEEIAALLAAFERVADTAVPELVLVSGYSGIGKSSLVHELEKPIVGRKGLFIEGKFDQHRRDVPYSTIVQAFRALVLDLLVEGEDRLAAWRQRLQAALGMNGQLIVDVIPQVELLVGRQPPVPELPPAEAQNRFRFVLRRFVGVFTERHPLTLFVDDLQWADPGSLALLQDLVTHPDMRSFLVVGAYRDNEVAPGHPLMSAVDSVRRAGARVSHVVVGPLSSEHLTALVADAFHCGPREAEPLAALVLEKTGANPFFVVQFLGVLYWEGLIAFDLGAGRWRWDVAKIRAQGYTDNVVDLMLGKLRHLPVATQEALELAACIGATVDTETLAIVCQRDPEPALRPALEADLLLRLERAYRFPHDRVQEAAYSLIAEGERAAVHLRIGRLLLARTAPGEVENEVFKIVNQLDRGAALITSREEHEQVAELNLMAGKRARRSTAYCSALKYLAAGAALLADDCWSRRYELIFALELHRAECEYLTGALKAAEERLSMLRHRARTLADLAAVTCLRLDLYTTLDQSDRGVDACLDCLRRVGIQWSPHPTAEDVRHEYDRIWRQLGSRPIEDLIDLPPMSDPDWRVIMDVLTSLHSPALFTDENLLCLLIGRLANLSLEHGYCDGSSLAYVWLGMILGPYFGDFRAAFRFGKLSLELVEKRGLDRYRARVYLGFASLNSWARHIRTSRELQRRAFDAATEIGDLTFAAYCCNNLVTNLLATGEPLGDVQREAEEGLAFARKMGFGLVVDVITSQLGLIRTLRGLTPSFSSSEDAELDEGRFERHLEADPRLAIATGWHWIRKLQARVFAEDYASAVVAASRADQFLWTTRSFFEIAEYRFYAALARAGHHDAAPAEERPRDLESLVAHREQLAVWAENCPENFENRHALVSAELARIEGRDLDAQRLYERAIRSSRENGFVQNEALACELASRFYRARGYERFADVYLRDARACYQRWGAEGKVRQLERLHPQLLERRPLASTATVAIRAEQLDLLSVVKASQTISGEILLEDLLGTLLRVVVEQGGAERAYLIRARGDDLSIEAEATAGAGGLQSRLLPSLPLEVPQLVPVSLVQYTRRTREPVILDDAAREPGKFSSDPYFARRRPRSVLCLPILRQADLLGLLYLENDLVAGAFTPDRLTALTLLASQAAISVENALLLAQERTARAAAQEQERRASFLAEAGALLSGSLDYEETLTQLSHLCVRSLADWCVLDLVEGREIRRLAGACADPAKEPLLEMLCQRHPARWDSPHPAARCLRTGEPLLVSQATDDDVRSHCEDEDHFELLRALGTRSGLVVPLVARGQTLGVFSMASATPGRYGKTDLELAQDLGNRAGVAIDNARLYREARSLSEAERRRAEAEAANRALQQQAVALEAGKRAREEVLAIVSHDIRSPLGAILMSAAALEKLNPEAPVAEMARLISRNASRMSRLANDLLDFSAIEAGRLSLARAQHDAASLARDAIEAFQPMAEGQGVHLIADFAPSSPRIQCDGDRIVQVLSNLLANAVNVSPLGGSVTVSVAENGGQALLSVKDQGPGIPPEDLPSLFDRYSRGRSAKYKGAGLGLAIARKLVDLHGGRIWVESTPGRGSTFRVQLPTSETRLESQGLRP